MYSLKEYLHKDPVDFQSNPARIAWVIKKTRRNVIKERIGDKQSTNIYSSY